jgi:hypothetical protein
MRLPVVSTVNMECIGPSLKQYSYSRSLKTFSETVRVFYCHALFFHTISFLSPTQYTLCPSSISCFIFILSFSMGYAFWWKLMSLISLFITVNRPFSVSWPVVSHAEPLLGVSFCLQSPDVSICLDWQMSARQLFSLVADVKWNVILKECFYAIFW